MTELLEKDKNFEWMSACEASFQELKKRLMTAPILVIYDMEKPFSIYCDVSGQGLGCVLIQDGHCNRTTSKMRGFVSQDHIGGFSTKRECANTHK
jgi:hypothetical protein